MKRTCEMALGLSVLALALMGTGCSERTTNQPSDPSPISGATLRIDPGNSSAGGTSAGSYDTSYKGYLASDLFFPAASASKYVYDLTLSRTGLGLAPLASGSMELAVTSRSEMSATLRCEFHYLDGLVLPPSTMSVSLQPDGAVLSDEGYLLRNAIFKPMGVDVSSSTDPMYPVHSFKSIGEETLIVPAGTFSCIVLEDVLRSPDAPEGSMGAKAVYWVSREVGAPIRCVRTLSLGNGISNQIETMLAQIVK